jgi:probable phosphoglycerate mutase
MTFLAILRHAPTAWNAAGRIQGRADVPLDAAGRACALSWRPPPALSPARWVASPLARARETARLMGLDARTEPALIEMDWGDWEGHRLTDLRQEGHLTPANEATGLDFRPPGGESPREVQARLGDFLAAAARSTTPVAAVSHKGVIRALLALATGWDMTGEPPARLVANRVHLFRLAPDGRPAPLELNLPLAPS